MHSTWQHAAVYTVTLVGCVVTWSSGCRSKSTSRSEQSAVASRVSDTEAANAAPTGAQPGTRPVEDANDVIRPPRGPHSLEELLDAGESIAPVVATMTPDELAQSLSAALQSDNANVRFNAIGYLLSHDMIASAELMSSAEKTLGAIAGGRFVDTHRGQETYALVKFLGRGASDTSVPVLLEIAEQTKLRVTWERETFRCGGGSLNFRPIFYSAAAALRACSGGRIGNVLVDGPPPPEAIRETVKRLSDDRVMKRMLAEWREEWAKHTLSSQRPVQGMDAEDPMIDGGIRASESVQGPAPGSDGGTEGED